MNVRSHEAITEMCNKEEGFSSCLFPCHYRTLEWVGFKGTLKIILFQGPCHGQGHSPLDQDAPSSIQSDLEHFQGRGTREFSGQHVPVSHCFHHKKKILTYSLSESGQYQLLLMYVGLSDPALPFLHFAALCPPRFFLLAGSAVLLLSKNFLFTHRN